MVDAAAHLPLVHARGLVKRFGELVAVDGVDFDVERGEAFGFLGPNGAGKTSTMRMIGCVSPPSGGTLSILGLDPIAEGADIRARLGVVPQQDTLDMELTVRENIIIYGRYFGLPRADLGRRADELIDFVQLNERALARERSRGDAVGRAHHRARPAGTAYRLGPALPAEAARRHPDSHDSLH